MNNSISSSSARTRESPSNSNSRGWKLQFDLLSKTFAYYRGEKAEKVEDNKAFQDLSGESIANYLLNLLGDAVDVINPDLNSVFSLFNPDSALEGARDLIMQLFDLKCNLIGKSTKEAFKINPDFEKPIIAVLNTTGKEINEEEVDTEASYGSHNAYNLYSRIETEKIINPLHFRMRIIKEWQKEYIEETQRNDSCINEEGVRKTVVFNKTKKQDIKKEDSRITIILNKSTKKRS